MQDHNVKQLRSISMYAKCIGGCMQGDSAGSFPGYVLKKIGEIYKKIWASAREKGPYGMHVRTEKIAFEVQWVKFTVGFWQATVIDSALFPRFDW